MRKGIIYANISENHKVAVGYLNWYRNQFRYQAIRMFQRQYRPDVLLRIMTKLEKQDYHFAARVRKSHHVCIPIDPMLMKLTEFLREQADKVLDEIEKEKNGPIQLEFNFDENCT